MVTTQGKPEAWRPQPDEQLSGNAYREFQDMQLTNLKLTHSESTGKTPQARPSCFCFQVGTSSACLSPPHPECPEWTLVSPEAHPFSPASDVLCSLPQALSPV